MEEKQSGKKAGEAELDPLSPKLLRAPGFWEGLREGLLGTARPFEVLQIEVSSFCPASCIYCPHTTMRESWKNRHISAETFAALWPLLRRAGRIHLQGWGEPFLHPRFLDFAAVGRRAGCRVSTTSCGLYMTEDFAAALVRSGIDVIAFSLTGSTPEQNRARQGAPFEKVYESIRILQKVRKKMLGVHLELHLAYLVLASQVEDLYSLPGLLDELDLHAAVVSTMDFIPSPELAHEAFLPHEADKIARARAVLEEVAARAEAAGRNIYYALPQPCPRADCLENVARSMYIDAEGNVSPCIYVNLPVGGANPLRRVFARAGLDDLPEAWEGEEFRRFRAGLAGGSPDPNCLDCPKRFARGNREG